MPDMSKVLVTIALVGVAGLSFYGRSALNDSRRETTAQQTRQEDTQRNVQSPANKKRLKEALTQSRNQPESHPRVSGGSPQLMSAPIPGSALTAGDFELGGFRYGGTKGQAASLFGNPHKEYYKGSTLYCEYADIEIHYANGGAITLLSNSAAVSTPRGIREGSSLSEVLSAYGTAYELSSYDGMNLYEYSGTTQSGVPYILRCAVNASSNRVSYVGIRTIHN